MRPSFAAAVVATTLCYMAGIPGMLGAQESPFPLLGAVASRTHAGLAVRKEPPKATAFSYHLGERICGVANGSKFTAFDQHFVANGEVWYQVEITEVKRPLRGTQCPPAPFSGWMVAQTKRNSVVEVLKRKATEETQQPSSEEDSVAAGVEPESDPSVLEFLAKYVLLVLGTAVGVAIISMEKKRSVRPATWLSAIVWLEFVVLSAANVLFVVLLIESKYIASDSILDNGGAGPLFAMVELFEAAVGGFLVLGFILTATWMKFMSFAAQK